MKLTNHQRNLRLKKLLFFVGLPALAILAVDAAIRGKGFILFMVVFLAIFGLGVTFITPMVKSNFENRNVVAFAAVVWLTISCAISFVLVEVLAVGV